MLMSKAQKLIDEIKSMEVNSNIYVSYSGEIVIGRYAGRGYRDGILIKRHDEVVENWTEKLYFIMAKVW